jgi:cytochrome c biogenesis protein
VSAHPSGLATARQDTPPPEPGERRPVTQPRLGAVGTARFVWRQLTSMRTALFLLLLLAVAAVPGSVLPQRGVDAGAVTAYLQDHPSSGPWLDRLGGFDVYASPWFSAIYLLLFVSLVGCVLPRTRLHLRSLQSAPPRAPRRLDRLPAHESIVLDVGPDRALEEARQVLRGRRYRVAVADGAVSAERGYLRETGNLLFHGALLVLLVAVAAGHLLGWRGDVIVPVGAPAFSNAVASYDTLDTGPWVDPEKLSPFSVHVDSMSVQFEAAQASARGAPRDFRASVTSRETPDAVPRSGTISVNHPLHVGGAKVFLLGNGYAPVITVRDSTGHVVYSDATPFLPQDGTYRSVGVVKAPGAQPQQIGLQGIFLPTAQIDANGMRSLFPDALSPAMALTAYVGDLGLASSRPQSVYTLDVDGMRQLRSADGSPYRVLLRPGQTAQLPAGTGSVTFERVQRYAGLSVRHDPASGWALGSSIAAILGLSLSLFVPRRRVFVRVRRHGDGSRTVVDVGALARGEDGHLDGEVRAVVAALRDRQPPPDGPGAAPPSRRAGDVPAGGHGLEPGRLDTDPKGA